VPKKQFECNARAGRKVGRRRLRWLEDVDNDLRELEKTRGGKRQIIEKDENIL
jgi:hypothetical protein